MTENNIDQNSFMFISLVTSIGTQAWIQLGKIKDPSTDKIERNLDGASMSIDMLSMLKEKTNGNLSEEEANLLEKTLADLRMNFVAESRKKPEEDTGEKSDVDESADDTPPKEADTKEETEKEPDAAD